MGYKTILREDGTLEKVEEGTLPPTNKKRLSEADQALILTLVTLPPDQLRSLLERVMAAGWGYAGLTGKDLLLAALKSDDENYEDLMLAALVLAKNASDWREFNALASFWAERKRGKPSQAIDVTAKIGIVDIVLEMDRQRKIKEITPPVTVNQ